MYVIKQSCLLFLFPKVVFSSCIHTNLFLGLFLCLFLWWCASPEKFLEKRNQETFSETLPLECFLYPGVLNGYRETLHPKSYLLSLSPPSCLSSSSPSPHLLHNHLGYNPVVSDSSPYILSTCWFFVLL